MGTDLRATAGAASDANRPYHEACAPRVATLFLRTQDLRLSLDLTDPSTFARVLLLRHAETAAPGQFHGAESDVGLGPRGFEQAEAAAPAVARYRPAAVYSSAMLRARQTAAPIARACGLEAVPVAALHERRMGALSGVPMAEGWAAYTAAMAAWQAGDLDAAHEGGESFAAIRDRVLPALEEMARRHPGATIAVVAHGVVIRVVLSCWLDGSPARFDRFGIDFVAVNDLHHTAEGWQARMLNGVPTGESPS